jgi:chromate transporter
VSLVDIGLLFARLGALSFGGGLSILAELQRELVDARGVLTQQQFATAFALGQATPGPGVIYMIPIGYAVAGVPGAVVALLSFLTLPLVLQLVVAGQWERLVRSSWVRALNRALVPISIGLVGASLHSLGSPLITDPVNVAGLLVGAAVSLALGVSPPVVVLGAGLLGLLGVL